jgi:hypothetical protein
MVFEEITGKSRSFCRGAWHAPLLPTVTIVVIHQGACHAPLQPALAYPTISSNTI